MNSIDVEIKKIFFEVFPDVKESEFEWNKKQNDYEQWDSFSQLNLITMIEDKFKIKISDEIAIELQSAKDLLDFVERNR